MERPKLDKKVDSHALKDYYYLKEELVLFCKELGLQTTGGKLELINRLSHYLDTGEKLSQKNAKQKAVITKEITLDTLIEENFVCSEKHRAFYQEKIGSGFSFNVIFQKWLKQHTGSTYRESIDAYYKIQTDKKNRPTTIDKQFEYNTYIRDFFADNKDKSLEQAIQCWNYKKSVKGNHRYEKSDLVILKQ